MGTQDSTAQNRTGQEFAGQVAIVTGGAGTIGEATAQLLIAEGASVVVADVDVEHGEASPPRWANGRRSSEPT